jgi:hypothetical protein
MGAKPTKRRVLNEAYPNDVHVNFLPGVEVVRWVQVCKC